MRDGCPCGTYGKCCKEPQTYTPDHDEPKDPNEFCEECYREDCMNCGSSCYCNL